MPVPKKTGGSLQPIPVVYDSAGELIKAFGSGGKSPENLGHGYDPAMNMVVRTNSGTPGVYGTNVLNQVTYDPGYTYTYDNNGNRTKRSAGSPFVEYAYDDEN